MHKPALLLCALTLTGCATHAKPGTLHYPPRAWNLHVGGMTTIMYSVEEDGSTSDVHMICEQPTGFFARNAIHDVQTWKYPPHHPKKNIVVRIKYVLPQVNYSTGAKPDLLINRQ